MADNEPVGPDLQAGIPGSDLAEGAMLQGHVGGDPVLLVRQGGKLFAVDALCTHYHGALADGLLASGTVHCPLHHACFDLATGEALHAPAIDPLSCWPVEQRDGRIVVGGKKTAPRRQDEEACKTAGEDFDPGRRRSRIRGGGKIAP